MRNSRSGIDSWSVQRAPARLSLAIVAINGWNRLNIAARTVPGDYVAGLAAGWASGH
jgi:hypothetical protein